VRSAKADDQSMLKKQVGRRCGTGRILHKTGNTQGMGILGFLVMKLG